MCRMTLLLRVETMRQRYDLQRGYHLAERHHRQQRRCAKSPKDRPNAPVPNCRRGELQVSYSTGTDCPGVSASFFVIIGISSFAAHESLWCGMAKP